MNDGTVAATCGSGFDASPAYTGVSGFPLGAATCGCTCGSVLGESCGALAVELFNTQTCGNVAGCSTVTIPNGTTCEPVTLGTCFPGPVGGSLLLSAGDPAVVAGSCDATATKSITSPSEVVACTPSTMPTQAGCTNADVCAPTPGSGFTMCVYQAGSGLACPSGYPQQVLSYASYTDSRACSACSCGSPTGASCGGTLSVSGPGCMTDLDAGIGLQTYTLPESCATVTLAGGSSLGGNAMRYDAKLVPGSCAASAVTATGAATPQTPTTFCCTP